MAVDVQALLDAIKKAIDASPAAAAFDGGYYLDEAPADQDLAGKTYCVAHVIDAPTDPRAGEINPALVLIQFDGRGDNSRTIGAAMAKLCAALDGVLLELEEGTCYHVLKKSVPWPVPSGGEGGKAFAGMRHWMVEYEYGLYP